VQTFLVGGAVRDALLGLPVAERDWVVVGATADDMLARGFRRVPGDFPVFLHPETGEEYALARRETKTAPGYRGFAVETGPDVTLEQDLARRDLTINAMAQDEGGGLIDPFGGRDDLAAGLLRHVTPAFVEDPVRLLRVARFAAKLGRWGFRVAHGTHRLMRDMVASGEVGHLQPGRVWQELRKALTEPQPWRFFEVLQQCGALGVMLPEAAALAPQPGHAAAGPAHGEDWAALRRVVAAGANAEARFAASLAPLLGDPAAVEALCRRLPVERSFRELLLRVVEALPRLPALAAAAGTELVAFLDTQRAWQHPQRVRELLAVCAAVQPALAAAAQRVATALQAASSVEGGELAAAGLAGVALREALHRRRAAAVDAALSDRSGAPT
jgi:tRNA nucleotidyltransferase (CCA-adding enzyme)